VTRAGIIAQQDDTVTAPLLIHMSHDSVCNWKWEGVAAKDDFMLEPHDRIY